MQRIKRVMAGLGSALMAGATLAAPVFAGKTIGEAFGEMTPANTVVVVGENAAVSDVVAAIAVAAKLGQHGATATVTGGTAVSEVSGGVSLDDPSDKIYLGDEINKVKDTLTSKDLPNILAKGSFEDDEGETYDYSQYIEIGDNVVKFVQENSDEDPVVEIDMTSGSAGYTYKYKVDFNKAVNFLKKDSDGRNVMAGNTLELGGISFTISAETTSDKLVLYKASESITLNMGDEKTVTVEGNEYTIKVLGFDTDKDEVVLSVNGVTDSVKEGRSRTIGGLEIYAKTVTAWNNGQDGIAVLQVGSEKITLENNQPVMVGDDEDEIDGTNVVFTWGNGSSNMFSVAGFEIQVSYPDSDNDYIAAGSEFVDPVFGTFKVKFDSVVPDLKDESRDVIKVKNDGDSKGYVEFKDKDGEIRKIYWAYDGSGLNDVILRGSDRDNEILVVEGAEVAEKNITFVSTGDEKYTHLLKVKDIKLDDEEGYVEFEDVVTGETYKTEEGTFQTAGTDSLDLIIDGKTYTVELVDDNSDSDSDGIAPEITVSYDADSKTIVYPTIELNNGEKLAVTDVETGLNPGFANSGDSVTYILPTGELTLTVTAGDGTNSDIVETTDGKNVCGGTTVTVGSITYSVTANGCDTDNAVDDITLDISISGVSTPALLLIEEENDAQDDAENAIVISTDDSDGNDKISFDIDMTDPNAYAYEGLSTSNDDISAYLDTYGTYAEKDSSDDDHTVVTVWYPDTQMIARIAVGPEPKFGAAVSGGTAEISFPAVSASMAKLDSEVSSGDKSGYNLILVGGPAINSLVAELADAGKTLTLDQWRTDYVNKAIVQVVEDAFASGKTALIVAGYEAADTRNAAAKLLSGELDNKEAAVISGDTVEDLTLEASSSE